MRANSRPVTSNQTGPHQHLMSLVRKHAVSTYLKPLAPSSRIAFAQAADAWQRHGGPLILDAGCGVGLSTRRLAALYPDSFVMGVDQSADRLQRDVRWNGPVRDNFITVRTDLVDFWRLMLAENVRPTQHYLLYPNPWPKKDHVGRRWHGHPVFPAVIALGGQIECRSNWQTYLEEFAAAVTQLSGVPAEARPFIADPAEPLTPFEEKYLASGHTLWRCRAILPGEAYSS
jgi:tRNA G46 methylase TrmB